MLTLIMHYIKITIGVLIALSASRFLPHPPNFTSLLALSFYIPAVFGIKFIPIVVLSLLFTDIFIGFHSTIIFTYGSVTLIGLVAKYFNRSILFRVTGALFGAVLFFFISNFGVWLGGSYGYNLDGIIKCYLLAIPFFAYSALSTLVFSVIIETIYRTCQKKFISILK